MSIFYRGISNFVKGRWINAWVPFFRNFIYNHHTVLASMRLRLCHQKSLIPSPQHIILGSRKRIADPVDMDNDLQGEMLEVLESQFLKQCSNRVVLPDDG